MADNEDGEGTTPRGTEWEVVSLTASAYAAAPGPKEVDVNDDGKESSVGEGTGETSQPLFMSRHFVFPPSQHENLPVQSENVEIHNEQGGEDVPELVSDGGGRLDTKDEENLNIKGLTTADDIPGLLFDGKGNQLSISSTKFEEGTALPGLNLVDKEQSIYSTANYSSFQSKATMGGSAMVEENKGVTQPFETSDQVWDSDMSHLPKTTVEDNYDGSDAPSEGWWKRQAASLYSHAKEANTFWSVFIAAAVMGLVIIGQRWQQERWQILQAKWQSDERMGRMVGPMSRLKDVIVGGNQRNSFILGSTTTDR